MLKKALKYCESHKKNAVRDLSTLVRIPSCSFPGFPAGELARSAKAVAALLRKSGLEHVKILRIPGAHPYVYADWLHAKGKPTALLYAHHDVQPPGRVKLWKSPPYSPTVRGGRLFGRGTADDKAGICVHAASIEAWLKGAKGLPMNVKVLIEGEEEMGSENLERFLKRCKRMLQADIMVIADTGNHETGLPSITTCLRGITVVDVTVRTADHPLHSGSWGGPLPDPVQALTRMLASLTDAQGRMAIPGIYKGVRPLTATEKKDFKSLRFTDKEYRRQAQVLPGVQLVGGPKSPAEKVWRLPALSINAIQASSKEAASNIVNDSAWCRVGIRTVPDMSPARTGRLLIQHLKENAPWGVKVEFDGPTTAPWWITDTEHPAFQAARRAMSQGFGRKAVFIGCGGSIGFVGPFSKTLGGAPALLIGVEDPYTNAHSENESLHLGDYQKCIRSSVRLFSELAGVPFRKKRR